jgi:hypothetical protein
MEQSGADYLRTSVAPLKFHGIERVDVLPSSNDLQGLQASIPQNYIGVSNAMVGVHLSAGPDGPGSAGSFIYVPEGGHAKDLTGSYWNIPISDTCDSDARCPVGSTCSAGVCTGTQGAIMLYVSSAEREAHQNLSKYPSNDDIWVYTVYFRQPTTGRWASLCPVDPTTGKATAMAVPMDPTGDWSTNDFTFACTGSGVAAKCARSWGYKPWVTDLKESVWTKNGFQDQNVSLKPFYDACLIAARADYCQDGQSFTKNGTLVDLFDTLDGITSINATAGLPYAPNSPEGMYMMHEEYQISLESRVREVLTDEQFSSLTKDEQDLVKTLRRSGMESSRYPDLDPGRSCAAARWIDRCDPKEPYACYRSTNMSTVPYGPFLAVNSPRHCSHNETKEGEALDPLCNECINRICKVDPTCCGDPGPGFYPGSLVWDSKCKVIGDQVCRSVPGNAQSDRWTPGTPAPVATGGATTFLTGAIGSFEGIVTAGGADGGAVTDLIVEGWSCDPDYPASSNAVQVSVGGQLGAPGATTHTTIANKALNTSWAGTVEEACGKGARHGFQLHLPSTDAGKDVYVYGIDLNVPGAPFALLRGGKKRAPGGASMGSPRAAFWTGYVQAPESASYTFTVNPGPLDPTGKPRDKFRLWVNGTYLAGNWKDDAFTIDAPETPPSIYLLEGVRYGVRVEYMRVGDPLPSDSAFSVQWAYGSHGPENIPTARLYPVGKGIGAGLQGSFFDNDFPPNLTDRTPLPQTVEVVDKTWTDGVPPAPGVSVDRSFAARYQGQVTPPVSGDYTFTADTDGTAKIWVNGQLVTDEDVNKAPPGLDEGDTTCAHDICRTGAAVSRTCKQGYFCASQICLVDPSCCSITWDAHCVQEVGEVCGLNCSPTPPVVVSLLGGVKYDIRIDYRHVVKPNQKVRGAHLKLMWAQKGGPRDVVPLELLSAPTPTPTPFGVGINAAYFSDTEFHGEYLDRVEKTLGFAANPEPDGKLDASIIDGSAAAVTGAPPALSIGLDHLTGLVATLRGAGAIPGATVQLRDDKGLGPNLTIGDDTSGGVFSANLTFTTRGAHKVTAVQVTGGGTSPIAETSFVIPGLPPAPRVDGPADILTTNDSVTVTGKATPGATVSVKVGGTTYSDTANGSGVWSIEIPLDAPGGYPLAFTQTTSDGTSEAVATVNIKKPLPILIVNSPVDNAEVTGALTISGLAPAALGAVNVDEGDGHYFVNRTTLPIDPTTGEFPRQGVPVAPLQLDYGKHLLKVFQKANGLEGPAVLRTVTVRPPSAGLAIRSVVLPNGQVDVPANPTPIASGEVRIKGDGGLRRACPTVDGGVTSCSDATGMPVRVRVYAGLSAADAAPAFLGEGTMADDGSFDVTVRLSGVGSRYISVSQVATSLSGGGSVESGRSGTVIVRARPGIPTLVKPKPTDVPYAGLDIPVQVNTPLGIQEVIVTADGGTPERTQSVTLTSAVAVGGGLQFSGSLSLAHAGTYLFSAVADADQAQGLPTTPAVLVVAGDVTPPKVTLSNGSKLPDLPRTTTDPNGLVVDFATTLFSSDNSVDGDVRAQCQPATGNTLPCTCLPASGFKFPLGATNVTCTAKDTSGNVGSSSFIVTVSINSAPLMSGDNALTVEAEGPAGAAVAYQVSGSGYVANCAPDGSNTFQPCVKWKPVHQGLGFAPQAIAVHPDSGTLYAGFFGRFSEIDDKSGAAHLFKSPPGGNDWTPLNGPNAGPIRHIVVGHGAPASLYIPSDPNWDGPEGTRGLWISHDEGAHWSLALPGVNLMKVVIDPAYPTQDHLLAWTNVSPDRSGVPGKTSPAALYESFDAGTTWSLASEGLPADEQILSVALDKQNPGRMYASLWVPPAGPNEEESKHLRTMIYRRTPGENWDRLAVPAIEFVTSELATTVSVAPRKTCDGSNNCDEYPALYAGFIKSTTGGRTFETNSFDFAAMAFDEIGDVNHAPGDVIYAVNGANSQLLSLDGGRTWHSAGSGTAPAYPNGSFIQDHANSNLFYAASAVGLFRTTLSTPLVDTTSIVTWVSLPAPGLSLPGLVIKDVAPDPVDAQVAYVVADSGAFRTSDGGGHWIAINQGLTDPTSPAKLGQIVVDRFDHRTIYTASSIGRDDVAFRMVNAATLPVWTKLFHTACSGAGEACFGPPSTATAKQATGRLTADPLTKGNWLTLTETPAANTIYVLQDSDAGPIRGTLAARLLATNPVFGTGATNSPLAYRVQLAPSPDRTMLISFATLAGDGLGSAVAGGTVVLPYDRTLKQPPGTPLVFFEGGKWAGLGASNVVLDSSDGVDRVYVGGGAFGPDVSTLYRARLADVRDLAPAAVSWEPLGGGAQFTGTKFTTLVIDPSSGGQHIYTLGSASLPGGGTTTNVLWESVDGGHHWQADSRTPSFLSRIWVSPADGSVYATVTPKTFSTNNLYLTTSSTDSSDTQPSGILWKRGPVTETPLGARIVNGDLPVKCAFVSFTPRPGDPADPDAAQRAVGPGSTFALGTTNLHCEARDVFGNVGPQDVSITVADTKPPVLTVPANISVPAQSSAGTAVPFIVTAKDTVDTSPIVSCNKVSGATFPAGSVTPVTCTATDHSGNSSTAGFTIVVAKADGTAAGANVFTAFPNDATYEADRSDGRLVTFTVSATKANGTALPTPPCTPASGSVFGFGTTTVNCTATNTPATPSSDPLAATRSFRVTVQDTTPPCIDQPAASPRDCKLPNLSAPFGSAITYAPTATDAVTATVPVSCTPASGTVFPIGKTSVTCRAIDDAGNQGFAIFDVTMTDVNPPALHLADMVVPADDVTGAWVTYRAADGSKILATDVEDAHPTVTCVPSALPSLDPNVADETTWFPIGETPMTCEAEDSNHNKTRGAFVVKVVDKTPPTVSLEETAPISAEAAGPDGTSIAFTVSVVDLVDPSLTVACERDNGFGAVTPVQTGAIFPLGDTKVTCRSTDDSGNTGELVFSVLVHDTKAPKLDLPKPPPATPNAPALELGVDMSGSALVTFQVSATDDVACPAGDTKRECAVACSPRTGTRLLPGLTTVTCTARDASRNESQGSFIVKVNGIGAACKTAAECGTGFCVDGVCCESACGGGADNDCQACSAAKGGSHDGQCTPLPTTRTCRESGGTCDVAETCDGVNPTCPADAFAEGTTCRDSKGTCDPAETCDGTGPSCPTDAKTAAGTTCRGAAGTCDVAETCDGVSNDCPADTLVTAGSTCRGKAGPCDVAEICDGLSAACPADAKVSAGTTCRAKAGLCDVAETCNGASNDCPNDVLAPAGSTCRDSGGGCDIAETCDGATTACPADVRKQPGTICRDSAGACDVAETCDGSAACPPDLKKQPGTICRDSAGNCDVAETCNGSGVTCPADAKKGPGTICRDAAGICDVAETCDGAGVSCPPDAKKPGGTICRDSAGNCDVAETCNGSAVTCPADAKKPAGTTCRAKADACDVAEVCSGSSASCPADGFASNGTVCGTPPDNCHSAPVCSGSAASCPPAPSIPCGDTTPPVFGPAPDVVAYATCGGGAVVKYTKPTATDAVDGVRQVTCTPASGTMFKAGKTTVTCTATDKKNNKATKTFTVWVQFQAPTDGTFFLAPIRSDGSALFKIGRPVPVRFKLTGASAGVTDLAAKLVVTKLSNTPQAGSVLVTSDETVDDTDMTFKYRSLLKWYACRWKTSNQTQGTFQLRADLGDGVTHQINVSIKP